MTAYTTLLLLIVLPLAGMAPTPAEKTAPQRAGKDFALFFAVDTYDDPGWKDLKNPGGDADALAKELGEVFGFQTTVYKNKTGDEIYDILAQWQKKNFPSDGQLLVFFSGHGDFNTGQSKGYFVPRDGKSEDPNNKSHIDLTTIGNSVTNIPCPHILLAIDACYSGTIDREIAFNDQAKPTIQDSETSTEAARQAVIDLQLRNKSRLLLTSGGKERTPDGTDHSPFTNGFLKALRSSYTYGDGLLTWRGLLAEMERVIPTPHEGTLPEDARGGFVFVAGAVTNPEPSRPIVVKPDPSVTKPSPNPNDQIPGPKMVFIKGGTFKRGDYNVTVSDFWLGETEVTNAQYTAFLNAKGNQTEGGVEWYNVSGSGYNGHAEAAIQKQGNIWVVKSGREDHPVNYVSWYGAKAYCDWLSEQTSGQMWRLPTEAEWEYAAGGGSSGRTAYAGANSESTLGDYAWYITNTNDTGTRPVRQKKPNSLGLYDMSGNVWEWCRDWSGSYPSSDISNPKGPDTGTYRVDRGGSWLNVAEYCRVSLRHDYTPVSRNSYLGFRPVRTN